MRRALNREDNRTNIFKKCKYILDHLFLVSLKGIKLYKSELQQYIDGFVPILIFKWRDRKKELIFYISLELSLFIYLSI